MLPRRFFGWGCALWVSGCTAPSSTSSEAPSTTASAREASSGAVDTTRPPTPPAHEDIPYPMALAMGPTASHACFVSEGGSLFCWGDNESGQLGFASPGAPRPIGRVPIDETVVSAAPGEHHTCALLGSGKTVCWGRDGSGARAISEPIRGLPRVVQLVSGSGFSCALGGDYTAWCWGTVPGRVEPTRDAIRIEGMRPREISATSASLCGLLDGGGGACIGDNKDGRFVANGPDVLTIPTSLANLSPGVSRLGISDSGLCVLRDHGGECLGQRGEPAVAKAYSADDVVVGADGTVCFLHNNWGASCEGIDSGYSRGWDMHGIFREVGVGKGFACALPKAREVPVCWGTNDRGQLGAPVARPRSAPMAMAALEGATQVAIGEASICGLMPNKKMRCIGDNGRNITTWQGANLGPLGDDAATNIKRVDEMAVGGGIRCGLTDRLATCWGDNHAHQLPDLAEPMVEPPVTLPGLGKPKKLVFGSTFACSIGDGDRVRCWGGEKKDRVLPKEVRGLEGAIDVSVGLDRGCALTRDGGASCFSFGGEHAFEASRVEGVRAWTTVAAGSHHFCGITADDGVACFGRDESGQLGRTDVGAEERSVERIAGLAGARQLALGEHFTCVLVDDGTVQCFGSSQERAPDASRVQGPTVIEGLNDAVAIRASSQGVVALTRGGKVLSWGAKSFFVGIGEDIAESKSPVPVKLTGLQ